MHRVCLGLAAAGVIICLPCTTQGWVPSAATLLAGASEGDAVVGARIRADGRVVLAANLGPQAPLPGLTARSGARGTVLLLSADGRTIEKALRVADTLHDLALDEAGDIFLAAGDDGVLKVEGQLARVLWSRPHKAVRRVDAAGAGLSVALTDAGIVLLGRDGLETLKTEGRHFTEDVCLDVANDQVIFAGFRNASAHDGHSTFPVQICYLRAVNFKGVPVWTAYDWSTDRASERFLNRPENNMADTRAHRVAMGADGKLYAAFEAAGGNHILRYSPHDIGTRYSLVRGDAHHSFHNSGAEHKAVFGRFEPTNGVPLALVEFCARLPNGRANTVRVKDGDIAADASGRVALCGVAAFGLPLSWAPEGQGEQTGGAFVLVMSPDLRTRELCTRLAAGAGGSHAVALRDLGRGASLVWGGGGVPDSLYKVYPAQGTLPAGVKAGGFFAVMRAEREASPQPFVGATPDPNRAARRATPEQVAQVDRILLRKLVELSAANALNPIPLTLSTSRLPVALTRAEDLGALTFAARVEGQSRLAMFRYQDLTLEDRANLAVLVTRLEPGNAGAHGLAGYFLECAGKVPEADRHFAQAGYAVRRQFERMFTR